MNTRETQCTVDQVGKGFASKGEHALAMANSALAKPRTEIGVGAEPAEAALPPEDEATR